MAFPPLSQLEKFNTHGPNSFRLIERAPYSPTPSTTKQVKIPMMASLKPERARLDNPAGCHYDV